MRRRDADAYPEHLADFMDRSAWHAMVAEWGPPPEQDEDVLPCVACAGVVGHVVDGRHEIREGTERHGDGYVCSQCSEEAMIRQQMAVRLELERIAEDEGSAA